MLLVILDREEDFLYGITSYFQEKLGRSFEICSFHTKEALLSFAEKKKKEIDVYLGSKCIYGEEWKRLQIKQAIYFAEGEQVEEPDEKVIYKYQSAEHIMKEFLQTCCLSQRIYRTGILNDTKILGVYSPLGRCGKTTFALVLGQQLAQHYKVVYVNLEEWSGFQRIIGEYNGLDISDLIYYIKQGKAELATYINGMLVEINCLRIIPPVKLAPDIQELGEEVNSLLQEIIKSDTYDVMIVDFGRQIKSMLSALVNLEKLYIPVLEDSVSQAKLQEFFQFLRTSEYAEMEKKIKQCKLSFTEQMECESIEGLYYGSVGTYVAELLKEEGLWNIKTESKIP